MENATDEEIEAITIYPPGNIAKAIRYPNRIFLAGSIEMGKATQWQQAFVADFIKRFEDEYPDDKAEEWVRFFNPRRKDWDSSWEQTQENPHFNQQVTWELDALTQATHIVMYFEPSTQSPISLLELGLFADREGLIVVCPDGFWRKGNVDIVCTREGIVQCDSLTEALEILVDGRYEND